MKPLPRDFYDRDTVAVASDLVGMHLTHSERDFVEVRRITETEAYLGMVDPASHVFGGMTPRTRGTWGQPGRAYVFSMHGHCCLNAITLSKWPLGCVLIRAVEGAVGPGKVTKALRVDLEHDGVDLVSGCLRVVWQGHARVKVAQLTRVGVTKAVDMPLRFVEEAL